MTDRVMCSNCGAPVTRQGSESSLPCPHCQVANDFPVAASAASAPSKGSSRSHRRDDDDGDDRGRGIPRIVIIQAPPTVGQGPRVVQSGPVYIQRRRSMVSYLIVPIIFVLMTSGVVSFIRARAVRLASEIPAAEKAAERGAEKGAERAPQRSPEHKSGKR
jgi:hypothetical protein